MKKSVALLSLLFAGSMAFGSGASATTIEGTVGEWAPTSDVSSIVLKVVEGPYVSWVTNGDSEGGFKVVWSKNTGPTYPNRDSDRYHYLSDPHASKDKLDAFAGAGTYYVRVCEYLGGKCGTYSNEVSVALGSSSEKSEKAAKEKTMDKMADKFGEYEKIPNIESIRYYAHIKKVGNDLYGIKIESMLSKIKKEKITRLEDVRLFKDIEKIGDSLYGVRMEDTKKKTLQTKINTLSEQMKKLQAQMDELNKQLSAL